LAGRGGGVVSAARRRKRAPARAAKVAAEFLRKRRREKVRTTGKWMGRNSWGGGGATLNRNGAGENDNISKWVGLERSARGGCDLLGIKYLS